MFDWYFSCLKLKPKTVNNFGNDSNADTKNDFRHCEGMFNDFFRWYFLFIPISFRPVPDHDDDHDVIDLSASRLILSKQIDLKWIKLQRHYFNCPSISSILDSFVMIGNCPLLAFASIWSPSPCSLGSEVSTVWWYQMIRLARNERRHKCSPPSIDKLRLN